jgi:hypothetical protein
MCPHDAVLIELGFPELVIVAGRVSVADLHPSRRRRCGGVGLQVGAGILGGLIAAYLFGRTLSGLLYGTSPADPASFAEGALAVLVVAMLASYLPARRAAAIDPLQALRRD